MDNKMIIQITNKKALGFLHELEAMDLIRILKKSFQPEKAKLSKKYKGIISKEQGKNLSEHSKQMRNEWSGI